MKPRGFFPPFTRNLPNCVPITRGWTSDSWKCSSKQTGNGNRLIVTGSRLTKTGGRPIGTGNRLTKTGGRRRKTGRISTGVLRRRPMPRV